jgi:hypothetical protein
MGFIVPIIAGLGFSGVTAIIAIGATIYQLATKDKRKAVNGADNFNGERTSRTGIETVVEGQTGYLAKVYGRAKIGGYRVYHNVSSDFFLPATNSSDITFSAGAVGSVTGTYTETALNSDGSLSRVQKGYTRVGTSLQESINGSKNEFLYFQQMLCVGPISSVRDVVFDGDKFLNNPSFSEFKTDDWEPKSYASMRLDYYMSGGHYGDLVSTRFGDRLNATFNGIAFFDAVIRLNKNDPQFYGVPDVQTFIEGAPVREIGAGNTISSTLNYSNNNALCLLDYLLDPIVGKGVDLSEIDFGSFSEAAGVCSLIVQTSVPVGGHIWQPTDNSVIGYATRDLPLYECNYVVDTSKSIRDNIAGILDTMGDARLVRSQGKYKLKLKYAYDAASLSVISEGTITDDDIALGSQVRISWPEAKDRLNHCIVRFHNEFEDFKEDSVSWPPKFNSSQLKGIGGIFWPLSSQDFDGDGAKAKLLNEYGVWLGASSVVSLTTHMIVEKEYAGNWTVAVAAGSTATIVIKRLDNSVVKTVSTVNGYRGEAQILGSSLADTAYIVEITSTATAQKEHSVAAALSKDGIVIWSTRSVAYSGVENINYDNTTYQQMLAEDSGFMLEADVFSGGVTDPYHALALAEEYVRVSRTAAKVEVEIIITDRIYEPGDYVYLEPYSMYFRVDEFEATENWTLKLKGARVDHLQFAWSQKPSQVLQPNPIFQNNIPAPSSVTFVPNANSSDSLGRLQWPAVNYSNIAAYIVYMHAANGPVDSNGIPLFDEIGRTTNNQFDVPNIDQASAFFGVRTLAQNGRMSTITYTSQTEATVTKRKVYSFQGVSFTGNNPSPGFVSWPPFTAKPSGSAVILFIPGGSYQWTGQRLYLYFDGTDNTVKSTTNFDTAQAFTILAEYNGGTNLVVKGSSLNPPINLIDKNGGLAPTFDISWTDDPNNILVEEILKRYEVVFLDQANNVLTSLPVEKGSSLVITQNANELIHGVLSRTVRIRVYAVNSTDVLSLTFTAATFNNVAAPAPAFQLIAGFQQVFVNITSQKAADHAYYKVYRDLSSLFVPGPTNLVYTGNSDYINFDASPSTVYYYKVSQIDTFGEIGEIPSGAQSVAALNVETTSYSYVDLLFLPNATTHVVSWDAFKVIRDTDGTTWNVDAGSATYTVSDLYLYYIPGQTILRNTTSLVTAVGAGGRILAVYKGGDSVDNNAGGAFFSGDRVLAGTVGANALVANQAIITQAAQIGDVLLSDGFSDSPGNYQGWRLLKNGSAVFNSIQIKNAQGVTLLSSGGIDWGAINDRPTSLNGINSGEYSHLTGIQAGATVGADSSNLRVGVGINRLINTEFTRNTSPFVTGYNPYAAVFNSGSAKIKFPAGYWWPKGGDAFYVEQIGSVSLNLNGVIDPTYICCDIYPLGGFSDKAVSATPGKRYEFHAKIAAHRCKVTIGIYFLNISGNIIGASEVGPIDVLSGGGDNLANHSLVGTFGIAPANTVTVTVLIRKYDSNDLSVLSSYLWVAQPYFGEALAGQTEFSPYSPGGVASTAQVTDDANLGGTAVWSGVSGSGRPVDNATRNHIFRESFYPTVRPDGSPIGMNDIWFDTTTINPVVNSWNGSSWVPHGDVTANNEARRVRDQGLFATLSKIHVGEAETYIENGAIGAAQIGSINLIGTSNFKVTTAASGARMDMDSRRIKVYDENGTLVMQFGDLNAVD